MPEQRVIAQRYWCPGPWPWQWARTCTRQVTKWCYDFSFLNVSYRFVYTDYWGCEGNTRYRWRSWVPPLRVEDITLYFYTRCVDNRMAEDGTCAPDVGIGLVGRALDRLIGAKVKEALDRAPD